MKSIVSKCLWLSYKEWTKADRRVGVATAHTEFCFSHTAILHCPRFCQPPILNIRDFSFVSSFSSRLIWFYLSVVSNLGNDRRFSHKTTIPAGGRATMTGNQFSSFQITTAVRLFVTLSCFVSVFKLLRTVDGSIGIVTGCGLDGRS
jgi:hypothetical protein